MAKIRGTWYFNDTLQAHAVLNVNVSFKVDTGAEYTNAVWYNLYWSGGGTLIYSGYDRYEDGIGYSDFAYGYDKEEEWRTEKRRLIDFGPETQDVSEEFYAWLTSNAQDVTIEGLRRFKDVLTSLTFNIGGHEGDSWTVPDYDHHGTEGWSFNTFSLDFYGGEQGKEGKIISYFHEQIGYSPAYVYDYDDQAWDDEVYQTVDFGYLGVHIDIESRKWILENSFSNVQKLYTEYYIQQIANKIREMARISDTFNVKDMPAYIEQVYARGLEDGKA